MSKMAGLFLYNQPPKWNENRIQSTCFRNNLQPAFKWLFRVARNTCLSEPAAVILMCGDLFQLGVLVFAESKGRQTKDTSAWHFQWCQSQEGLFRVRCLHEGWCNHTQFSASAHVSQ